MPAIREYRADVFDVPIDEDWLDAQAALRYSELAAEASLPTTPIRASPASSKPSPLQCVLIPPTPNTSPPNSATSTLKLSAQWIHRQPKVNASPTSWRHNVPPAITTRSSALDIQPPPHKRLPSTSSVSSQSSAASSNMPVTPPDWSTTNLSSSAPPFVTRSILSRTASKRSTLSTNAGPKSVKFNESPRVYSPIYDWNTESEQEDVRMVVPRSIPSQKKKPSPLRRLLISNSTKGPIQPATISGPFALGSFTPARAPEVECERVRPKGARARPDQTHARRSSLPLHRTSSVESMKSARSIRSIGGRSVKSESGKSVLSISSVSSGIRDWLGNLKAVGRRAG